MLRVLFLACCLLCPSVVYADAFGVEMGSKAEKYGIAENPSPYLYVLKNVPKPHVLFHKYAVLDTPKNGISVLQAQTTPIFISDNDITFDKIKKSLIEKYGGEEEKAMFRSDGCGQFVHKGHETNAISISPKKSSNIDDITIGRFKIDDHIYVFVIQYRFKNSKKMLEEYNEMWREAF